MQVKDFQDIAGQLDKKLHELCKRGEFRANLADGYKLEYENLIREGLASNENSEIIKQIAFYLFAGAMSEAVAIGLQSLLNDHALPLVEVQKNAFLNMQLERNNALKDHQNQIACRSKGGKNRAENDKKHQTLNDIVNEYQARVDGGYRFEIDGKPIRGRLTNFYKEMENKNTNVDRGSIENRIRQHRKTNSTS